MGLVLLTFLRLFEKAQKEDITSSELKELTQLVNASALLDETVKRVIYDKLVEWDTQLKTSNCRNEQVKDSQRLEGSADV